MKRICSTIATIFFSACSVFAGGTDGFEFLRLDLCARAAAMGGASAAGPANLQTLTANPAAVAGCQTTQAAFSYQNYVSDIQSGVFLFQKRCTETSNVAAHLAYMNYGDIERIGPQGQQNGTFTPGDLALGVSYAARISSRLSWGVSAKFIRSQLDQYTSSAAAADAGLLLDIPVQLMRVGLSVQNFGRALEKRNRNNP